jgi:hypothetical protein
MNEEFDTLIHPHPLPHMRYENHFKVDPIRIDPIINIVVRLDSITVHISQIGLVRAEAPVDEPASYFFKCCPMITGRQRPGGGSKAGITPPP